MSKAEELKSYLPTYYQDSIQMNAKCDTTGAELDDVYSNIDDVTNQCFPQRATWGLSLWEAFLGLPINDADNIKNRRAKVMAKLSRTSPMTPAEMKKVLKNFAEDAAVNLAIEPYTFMATLISSDSFNLNVATVINEIENIKPCHLDFDLSFQYNYFAAIKAESSNIIYDLPIIGGYCGMIPTPVLGAWTVPTIGLGATDTITKILKDYKFCGTNNCAGGIFI